MQLKFERFDGRSQKRVDVVDLDTGEKVGAVRSSGTGIGYVRGATSMSVCLRGNTKHF